MADPVALLEEMLTYAETRRTPEYIAWLAERDAKIAHPTRVVTFVRFRGRLCAPVYGGHEAAMRGQPGYILVPEGWAPGEGETWRVAWEEGDRVEGWYRHAPICYRCTPIERIR